MKVIGYDISAMAKDAKRINSLMQNSLRTLGLTGNEPVYYSPELSLEELMQLNIGLVLYFAEKLKSETYAKDELFSEGIEGLVKAIKTFDPIQKTKFATYASKCIVNQILQYIRKENRLRFTPRLSEEVYISKDGDTVTLEDTLADNSKGAEEQLIESQVSDELKAFVGKLPLREQKVLVRLYGLDGSEKKSQRQLESEFGVSQKSISRFHVSGIKKLKEMYKNKDIKPATFQSKFHYSQRK